MFLLGQLFALGFNVGVLVTTLARVFFSDTAFGWQSTLQVGPELVHGLVSMVALPWSWLFPPGIGCPTPEAVAGSRMILKDGIYHLTTGDLVSWWPFLCLCVFFYGLLPRMALLGVGHWMKKRSIDALTFDHASCQRLLTRMTTPLVSIDGSLPDPTATTPAGTVPVPPCPEPAVTRDDEPSGAGSMTGSDEKTDEASPSSPDPLLQSRRSLVLVSEDLAELVDDNELAQQVLTRCGTTMSGRVTVGANSDRELEEIRHRCHATSARATSIVWVQEAWQPPIKETLHFIRELRRVAGDGMDIIVGLVGKPAAHTVFTPPGAMDLSVWHKKLDGLGDPRLRIESLEVLS